MSKRNWVHYIAIGGFLIACQCLSPIAIVQAQVEPQAKSRHQGAAQIETEPTESWNRISPDLLLHFLRRIADALETEAVKDDSPDKTQREKDDLSAQQEMANSALWMVFAAFLQVFVGGFGIIYIRKTLLQNEAAVKAAIKSSDAIVSAERARFFVIIENITTEGYLKGIRMNDHPTSPHPPGKVRFRFKFKNYGKTPGTPIEIMAGISISKEPPEPVFDSIETDQIGRTLGPDEESATFIIEKEDAFPTPADGRAALNGETYIWIYGRVIYSDIFGNAGSPSQPQLRFYRRILVRKGGHDFIHQHYDYKHYNQST